MAICGLTRSAVCDTMHAGVSLTQNTPILCKDSCEAHDDAAQSNPWAQPLSCIAARMSYDTATDRAFG